MQCSRNALYHKTQLFRNTITLQVYSGNSGRAMVFTSTKSEANELALNAVLKQVCVCHCYYMCYQELMNAWHYVNKNASTSVIGSWSVILGTLL